MPSSLPSDPTQRDGTHRDTSCVDAHIWTPQPGRKVGGGIDSRGDVSDSLAKAKDIFRVQFWRAEDGSCWARIDSPTVGARVGPGGLPRR